MKIFTKKMAIALFMSVFFVSFTFAAEYSINVSPNAPDSTSLIKGLKGLLKVTTLADGDIINVNVLEGELLEPISAFVQANPAQINLQGKTNLTINIIGRGADKSALKGNYPTQLSRLWQQNDATLTGVTFNFKNLTFKNFGSNVNSSGGNGVIFNLSVGSGNYNFENVVFTNNTGRSLFSVGNSTFSMKFNNCLFKENHLIPTTNPNTMNGIINNSNTAPTNGGAANLEVKNCTFMSNDFKALSTTGTQASAQGALVYVGPGKAGGTATTIENCVAINNRFIEGLTDAVSSMIYINSNTATSPLSTLTLNNNLFIDNARAASMDKDIFINNPANIDITSDKNITQSAIQIDGAIAEPVTYKNLNFTGLKISADYTYTDPRIAFTMDGALPLLTADAYGVGKVTYTGNGGTPTPQGLKSVNSSNIKFLASPKSLVVEGAEIGLQIEVYSMSGSLVSRTLNATYRTPIAIKQGLYLVKVGNFAQKVQIN